MHINPPQEQLNTLVQLCNAGRFVEAEKNCKKLLKKYPQAFVLLNILGGVLSEQGRFLESVKICDRMIKLNPDFVQAYYNRGVALQKLGNIQEAISSLKKAIELKPDYAQAHSDLSLLLLLQGELKEGWYHHEWRMMAEREKGQIPVSIRKWKGESLKDKVLLVRAEQGIGDEVMFSSCFPDLIALQASKIIVECDARLKPLFSRSFPELDVCGNRDSKNLDWLKIYKTIDYQIAIGDLPMFFRTDFESFPEIKSFLIPDKCLLDKWKTRYEELGEGKKIGISWHGGSRDSMKISRTIEPELWKKILQSDADFINLQYGDCADDLSTFEQQSGVHIHDWDDADPLTDLNSFTAQIASLDLVISIDNSTVHFAGAVGTPVWVLIPAVPDWRWLQNKEDSLWYSSIKLYRKGTSEKWPAVLNRVQADLKLFCDTARLSTT